jgi:hypothetical protein
LDHDDSDHADCDHTDSNHAVSTWRILWADRVPFQLRRRAKDTIIGIFLYYLFYIQKSLGNFDLTPKDTNHTFESPCINQVSVSTKTKLSNEP